MTAPRSPFLSACLAFVRLIGFTLPRAERREWVKDWQAEVRGEWLTQRERGRLTSGRKVQIGLHALGAAVDAATFWTEAVWSALRALLGSLRAPWRQRRMAAVVVITLALGIGSTTALFTVIHGVLLRPLDYPESDRLVMVWDRSERNPDFDNVINARNWWDWRERNNSLDAIAIFNGRALTLPGDDGEPQRFPGLVASGSYFTVLGVPPALGRWFTPADDRPGAAPVVVISHGYWQRWYGGDSTVVGRLLRTSAGETLEIIGVMPEGFRDPGRYFFDPPDLWVPFQDDYVRHVRNGRWLRAVGRLRPGLRLETAGADLERIAAELAREYPESNAEWSTHVVSLHDQIVGDARPALLMLSVAVTLVLLIACANVANLMLSRAVTRSHEFALRAALGASRARLLGQLLAESLSLAAIGGVLGIGLAQAAVPVLAGLAPDLPRADQLGVTPTVLVFAIAVTTATGVLFGIAPALQAGDVNPMTAFSTAARGSDGRDRRRLRNALVISEVALSLLLLIGAGLMTKSFLNLRALNPGFDASNVLTMRLNFSRSLWPERPQAVANILERVNAIPGVTAAGAVSTLPIDGTNNMGLRWGLDGTAVPNEVEIGAMYREASPDYFAAMGLELIAGRLPQPGDVQNALPVAVVNDAFVRLYLNGEDPLGKRVRTSFATEFTAEVVGVVKGVRYTNLSTPPDPEVYVPQAQHNALGVSFLTVKTDDDPLQLAATVRAIVRSLYPTLVIDEIGTMEQIVAGSVARPRFTMLLTLVFSATALVLAAVGLYAVLAYSVAQRRNEMGIRMALGARSGNVVDMVVRDGMKLVAIGAVLGVGSALALMRVVRTQLYEVTPFDPTTYVGVTGLVVGIALVASLLPARRAAGMDPVEALRRE